MDFVCFGRVEVTGVERQQGLVLDGVAHIEFVGSRRRSFRTDAEQLAFDGVAVEVGVGDFGRKHLIQTLFQSSRWRKRSTGVSLYPSGIQTLLIAVVQLLADIAADFSLLMQCSILERTHSSHQRLAGQRKTFRHRMQKTGWIKVDAVVIGPRPIRSSDPK